MADASGLAKMLCDKLTVDELEILREDPFEAIPLIEPAISIDLVSYEPGEGCSVEGLYHESSRSITVQQAASRRRTCFTAIHEFGHDRARHDKDVARHLAYKSVTASRQAEERVADAFAAAVLIPDLAVDDVLNDRAPSADHLVELFHRCDVAGSREACCVRIAQRMRGEGYVILVEGGVLRFCATVGGAYAIKRGAAQHGVGLLERAVRNGLATDPNTRLQFPDGRFTGEYAGQAVIDDIYTFAVLIDSTTPPWGGWIPPRRIEGEAPEIFCAECDEVTEAWQRCETIPSHRVCSICGWCECRAPHVKVPERTCDVCTLRKRVDLFPGDGPTCRDCL
jgi:hypothetical protein